MSKIYAYIRVSSKGQSDNNSFSIQEKAIRDKYKCDIEVYEEVYTATKARVDRKVFNALVGILEKNDTLVVAKLDRLARNTIAALTTIKELLNRGVTVDILDFGICDGSPTSDLLLTVLSAVASFEAESIKSRCRDGKEAAKLNPLFRDGRPPKFNPKQISHALELLEVNSYSQVSDLTGISISTLARAKRSRKMEEAS